MRTLSIVPRAYRRIMAAARVLFHGYPVISTGENSAMETERAAIPKLQFGSKPAPKFSDEDLLNLKEKFGYPFKLTLGCGDQHDLGSGYIHVDIRETAITNLVAPVESTGLPKQSCDVIIAWNVLEHVSWRQTQSTLQHWFELLQPSGRLALSVPNLKKLALDILEADSMVYTQRQDRGGHIIEHLYGGQHYDGSYHLAGWKPEWLAEELRRIGFTIEFVGTGNLQDFGFPFDMPAGASSGANGWDMLAIAERTSD